VIEKIDISQIVASHIKTLRSPGSSRVSGEDIVVFFGLPIFSGVLYFLFSGPLPVENKIDEMLIAAFSIFAALMLNIQVFLLGFRLSPTEVDRSQLGTEDRALLERRSTQHQAFLSELFANISYAILLAMGLVFITLFCIFCQLHQLKIVKVVQFVLILHFALTLLMVMKRVNALFIATR